MMSGVSRIGEPIETLQSKARELEKKVLYYELKKNYNYNHVLCRTSVKIDIS